MVVGAADARRGSLALEARQACVPTKCTLQRPGGEPADGLVNALGAYLRVEDDDQGEDVYGVKLFGSMFSNVERDLPRGTGVLVLFDPDTKVRSACSTRRPSARRAPARSRCWRPARWPALMRPRWGWSGRGEHADAAGRAAPCAARAATRARVLARCQQARLRRRDGPCARARHHAGGRRGERGGGRGGRGHLHPDHARAGGEERVAAERTG